MAAKWWYAASLLLCLAVAAASAREMPRGDCHDTATATFAPAADTAGDDNNDVNAAGAVDESKTADVFGGQTNGGGLYGGVHGPLGGGVAGFGPFGGAGAGAAPFLGFGGGGGLGGGGGGGAGGVP
ncbi:hypothetical protein BS78_02G067700 [Paspalum vaginatum]|nr:hypothetical protein BS78_02G067700 [Paspalum vaginatum]